MWSAEWDWIDRCRPESRDSFRVVMPHSGTRAGWATCFTATGAKQVAGTGKGLQRVRPHFVRQEGAMAGRLHTSRAPLHQDQRPDNAQARMPEEGRTEGKNSRKRNDGARADCQLGRVVVPGTFSHCCCFPLPRPLCLLLFPLASAGRRADPTQEFLRCCLHGGGLRRLRTPGILRSCLQGFWLRHVEEMIYRHVMRMLDEANNIF